MRETSHLSTTCRTAIITTSQGNTEHLGSLYSILAISFIEVTTSEKQQCLGMFRFHLKKLPHHRRKTFIIVCHLLFIPFVFLSLSLEDILSQIL